jgi:glycosyltransferase involved in cell wall biosynthesis
VTVGQAQAVPALGAVAGRGAEHGARQARIGTSSPARPPDRRILHVCTRYIRGGSEQRLRDIVSALDEDQHDVVLGHESDLDLLRRHLPGVQVFSEPMIRRDADPVRDLIAVRRLIRRIAVGGYDAVVTHQSKAGALGRLAARAAGKRPVVHSLSMPSFGPGYGWAESSVHRLIERRLEPWTTRYAVVGADLVERFETIGVPRAKLSVIRSAVRLPMARAPREQIRHELGSALDLDTGRSWMLYLGSLDDRKNVLSLPVFLQQVIQLFVGPRPVLLIAGAGPLERQLQALAERIGVGEDIRVLGHVEDPSDLVVAAEAMVLLSRAEGLPQVLVQSAAVGTPFVATEVDGVDELLALGAAGYVVDQEDVVGAARAMLPYLRWPARDRRPTIDLSAWQRSHVRRQYRELFASVAPPKQPAPEFVG